MKKILIDVFGSDHPEQLLEGCARCTLEVPDVMLVLPGEEAMLRAELEKYPCNWDALEFMPASARRSRAACAMPSRISI